MNKAVRTIVFCSAVLLFCTGAYAVYRLFIQNRSNIDLSKFGFVTTYLHDTYGGSYTMHHGRYVQYDYGITGGMQQYYFYVYDETGREYVAHYCSMAPFSAETVSSMTFEEVY